MGVVPKKRFAVKQHEYCLLYAKNAEALEDFWLPPDPGAEESIMTVEMNFTIPVARIG